jgi:segregation and condensation protein A
MAERELSAPDHADALGDAPPAHPDEHATSTAYRVRLDVFSGPLDLLLYLIQKDELDIQDVALAKVTRQYLDYCALLEELDPNAAGDFLVLAATLIELKSRAVLPSPPIEAFEDTDAGKPPLVRQLLEYKRFKDAARLLAEAADERRQRFPRAPGDAPEETRGVELEDVEVWRLFEAFAKVMRSIGQGPATHNIRRADLPIEDYMDDIVRSLQVHHTLRFTAMFHSAETREVLVARFLALLELVKLRRVRAAQDGMFGDIMIYLREPEADETAPPAPLEGD